MAAPPPTTDTKQQIIASLFNKRAPDGVLEETYIAHLKIWEDVPEGQSVAHAAAGDDGRKARYLMLAVTRIGKVLLHKAKRNTNMTFSKGKTWNLEDLRQMEVMDPQTFALTMTTRTYVWQTEKPRDQSAFLTTTLKVYRKYTQGKLPQMIGISLDEPGFSPGGMYSPLVGTMSPSNLQPPMMLRDRQGSSTSFSSQSSAPMNGSHYSPSMGGGRPSNDLGRGAPSPALPPPIPIAGENQYGRSPLGRSYMDQAAYANEPPPPSAMSSAYSAHPNPPFGHHQQQGSISGMPPQGMGSRRPSEGQQHSTPMQASGSAGSGMSKSASERSIGNGQGFPSAPQNGGAMGRKPSQPDLRQQMDVRPPVGRNRSDSRAAPPPPQTLPVVQAPSPPESKTPTLNHSRSRERLRSQAPDKPNARDLLTPTITTTSASPSSSPVVAQGENERKLNRRTSFQPPPQSTGYSREVLLRGGSFSQAEALVDGTADGLDLEDETMANVEEMLEGFDWSLEGSGQQQQSTTEAVEARLLDELNALEAANIHAFLEQDDRIGSVLKGIDEAVGELNEMDSHLAGYKLQLNGVTEDIAFIESLNRGLQVQTSNQKALLNELEILLTNMSVDTDALKVLTQGSLETDKGIESLESALAALYRALLASRDTDHGDMAATMQHVREYDTHNRQFCTRLIDYLLIMFKFQAEIASSNAAKQVASGVIPPHAQLEDKLGKYCGLILYMKEMDEERYQKLCANYFSSASDLHAQEMKACFMSLINKVKRPTEDDKDDGTFVGAAALYSTGRLNAMQQRSKAIMGLRGNDKKARPTGEMPASEAFERGLEQISGQVSREEAFIADFLQISDAVITYADYMDLDVYFRRQASRLLAKGMSPATVKLRRSALDLIFAFLSGEIKNWVDGALQREPLQIFGISAACDRFTRDAEARNAIFFLNVVQRQQQRMQVLISQFISEQIKVIEMQKSNPRRRKGAAFFVRQLPAFAYQIEQQLVDCGDLSIRQTATDAYDRIMMAVFDTIEHIAKTDRTDAGEEKGQLNYHIIMIENMHVLIQDATKVDLPALDDYVARARELYDEHLLAYVRAVLRKSFAKPMDFFGAVQRQLENASPQEVSASSGYNKSALKRATKDISTQKEVRKAIEAMSKRVEKHYADEVSEVGQSASDESIAGLVPAVWQACQKNLTDEVGMWVGLMGRVYAAEANQGIGLEYGADLVQSLMQKFKP